MSDVALLDSGVGNLHSLSKALVRHGARVRQVRNATAAAAADILVLPGVGAFGAAAAALGPHRQRLRDALDQGLPCLGICLGMQLLFERSEVGVGDGIGLIPGRVRRLRGTRVPHMGWNSVLEMNDDLFLGIDELIAYYANSYIVEPAAASHVIAWTEYHGARFPAAVRRGRVWGVQFHPEKSAGPGLRLLDNFMELARS